MSRYMSVAETEQAVVDRVKTETRRLGWWKDKNGRRLIRPGDRLTLVRKSMGRRRPDGSVEPIVVLAEVEVVSVHREKLRWIDAAGVAAEGVPLEHFGGRVPTPVQWVRWYARQFGLVSADEPVTVIRWRYLPC